MASVTKSTEEKRMADEELPDEPKEAKGDKPKGEKPGAAAARSQAGAPGFFTIYKKGQGYWTRICTVFGAALIGAFTAYNVYVHVPTMFGADLTGNQSAAERQRLIENSAWWSRFWQLGLTTTFVLGYVWLCWRLINKPKNADFLIATDSEMKKVNWTSRKELIGSTQIVVIFMFLIAFFLFTVDQIFGWLMYWAHVLISNPFGGS